MNENLDVNIFEAASRMKLRFIVPGKGGSHSTESLWELATLTDTQLSILDTMYTELHRELSSITTGSLSGTVNPGAAVIVLKMKIIKHIYDFIKKETDARKEESIKRAQISALKELRSEKIREEMTLEDINKQIAALGG